MAEKPAKAGDPVDLERHDEIYFKTAHGHSRGKVLAHGKHGATVECGGKRRRVKHEHIIGHKVRAQPELKVVDEGEDGFLAIDATGRKRFISDPVPAQPAAAMVKAWPTILLFTTPSGMAKALKGRPGLTLQGVTDKAGHQTKRWKKTGQDAPAPEHHEPAGDESGSFGAHNLKDGDKVEFAAGDFKGRGEIVGTPGEQGAHVKDGSGRLHQLLWSEITGRGGEQTDKPAKVSPPAKPEGGDEKKPADVPSAQAEPKPFYSPETLDALPARVNQPVNTWEGLSTKGEEGLSQFEAVLGDVAKALGLRTDARPGDLEGDNLTSDEGFLFVGRLKSPDRAKEKVEADYAGDWSQLRDLVRGTISVASMDDLRKAIGAVEKAGLKLAQKPKDRFAKPTYEGYRDLMTIVTLPNGMLAELQFHLKGMTAAKSQAHKGYEVARSLRAKYGDSAPTEAWSDEDHAAFYESLKQQREIYGDAWEKASEASR